MGLKDLPTLGDMRSVRQALPKGATRLEDRTAEAKAAKDQEEMFKRDIWVRDKRACRCCGRKVKKTLALDPLRGEVHHIHGRPGPLRFEPRAALLLCLACHQKVTGMVAKKLKIVGTAWFTLTTKRRADERFIDARQPVKFQEVA